MRIKTKNKIVEVSNIEFDHFNYSIYIDEINIRFNFIPISIFNNILDDLLTQGYADLSSYKEI